MSKNHKKTSRHIPTNISSSVKKRHHFECAWCGIKLTERHHIKEFSSGGLHITENLILLCPICHKKAHSNVISTTELLLRKSTHFKSDRISANFQTTIEKLKFKIGGTFYFETENFLTYKNERVLHFELRNKQLYINLKFFNKDGYLIFWMSDNYFWYSSVFRILSGLDFIEIIDCKENFIFKVERIEDYLKIRLKTFIGGDIFDFDENFTNIGNMHLEIGSIMSKNIFQIN